MKNAVKGLNRRDFLTLGACAAAVKCIGDPVPEVDPAEIKVADFDAALRTLRETTMFDAEKRKAALEVVQKHIYAMKTAKAYERFRSGGLRLSPAEVAEFHRENPPLRWYDEAFDRVRDEVRTTSVTGDRPAIWYVYNMGVVVRTKTCVFAIDLCHRKACELIPDLDFALCTHNHDDHFTEDFMKGMVAAGKPFVSNFDLQWNWYTAEERTLEIKGVRIHVTRTDHNKFLPKAMNCYEVECGGETPFVIFHSGDSHRPDQLRSRTKNPDVFFGHCAIGFSFPEAYQTTMSAKLMVPLHHQELGHLGGRWRCVGFHEEPVKVIRGLRELGARTAMPVWGDRIC